MEQRLEFGTVMSKVFDLYGTYFRQLMAYGIAFYATVGVVFGILGYVLMDDIPSTSTLVIGGVILGLGYLVAVMALTAAMTFAIGESNTTGTFPSAGAVWPKVKERLGPLLWTTLVMVLLAIPIAIALGFIVGVVLGALGGLGAIVGVIGYIALAIFLAVKLLNLVPIIVFEGLSGLDAIRASWNRVAGNEWTAVGIVVATFFLLFVANMVISLVFGAILGFSELLSQVVPGIVAGVLTLPFSSLVQVVVYQSLQGDGSGEVIPPPNTSAQEPTTPDAPESSGPFV